ncbi:MAG: DUF554 domain-containing protein [Lachnospiraceae bacterium]|nr:DUF554 domain-containing protein [Lachnospiraceae bacterium]
MIGLGTIINTAAVIAGGIIGLLFGKLIPELIQKTLIMCNGICVMFIGVAGAMAKMLTLKDGVFDTQKSLLLVLAMVLGTIVGELVNLEKQITRFGDWLKRKTKSTQDNGFTDAFITASCTVCIGAMAVIGAINDAMFHDYSILITKSIIDLITICIMTCTLGKGAAFSAIPVFLFQGIITVLAKLIMPVMTDLALADLSMVGSVLIFCVGLNLIRDKKVPVANMLPAILFAIGFSFIPGLN